MPTPRAVLCLLVEQDVVESRDVAGRVDVLDVRLHVLVDDDPVVLRGRAAEELGVERQSDRDAGPVAFVPVAVRIDRGGHVTVVVGFELADAAVEHRFDADVAHSVVHDLRAVGRERVAPPAIATHEVLSGDALCATDRREVDSEETGTDDDGFAGFGALADSPCVLERPEVVDSVGVTVLDRKLGRRPARRDQQFVVGDVLTLVDANDLLVGVDRRYVRVEREIDVALVVPPRESRSALRGVSRVL